MNRRSFFGALTGTSAIAAAAITTPIAYPEPTQLDAAIEFGNPICPHCCCVQPYPSRHDFESQAAWVTAVTTPREITCVGSHCQRPLRITFARRMV